MYSNLDLKLIRIFGRKDLEFGCIFSNFQRNDETTYYRYAYMWDGMYGGIRRYDEIEYIPSEDCEILGHIPHLEDVFRVAKEEGMSYFELNDDTIEFWNELGIQKDSMSITYNPTIPLLEQSEETKQALITLFEPGN